MKPLHPEYPTIPNTLPTTSAANARLHNIYTMNFQVYRCSSLYAHR